MEGHLHFETVQVTETEPWQDFLEGKEVQHSGEGTSDCWLLAVECDEQM